MITFGGVTIPLARLLLYEDLLEERFYVLMRLLRSGLVVADRRTLAQTRVCRREELLRDGIQDSAIISLFKRAIANRCGLRNLDLDSETR